MSEKDLISFDDDISIGCSSSPPRTPVNSNPDRYDSIENVFIAVENVVINRTVVQSSNAQIVSRSEHTDEDTLSVTSQSSGTKTPCSSAVNTSIEEIQQVLGGMSVQEKKNKTTVVASTSRISYHGTRKPAVIMAKKKAPAIREGKEQLRLLTNFYTLTVRNKVVYRYDINVTLMRPAGRNNLNLAKGCRDDNARTESHQICLEALRRALETYRMIREGGAFVYDGASIMFSSDSLELALKQHGNTLTISVDQLPASIRKKLDRFPEITDMCIELQPCKEFAAQFDIANFQDAHNQRDVAHLDRTWKQFFEMLTNQQSVSSGKYFCFGAGKLFPTAGKRENARGGQERVLGANKGIKFIQASPDSNRIVPALVLDAKIGQFFKAQSLVFTICEFMRWPTDGFVRFPFEEDPSFPGRMNKDWKAVNDYIKGMRLIYTSSTSGEHSFIASGISDFPLEIAEEKNFQGQMIPTAERFPDLNKQRHRFHWPVVLVRVRENGRFVDKRFPVDLLQVAPYQRVPKNKQVDDPPRAGPPQNRFRDISNLMNQLDLDMGGSRNVFLNAFGVSLSERPIQVDAIRRERPKILYNNRNGVHAITTDNEKACWKMDHGDSYVGPGKVGLLFIAHTCSQQIAQEMTNTIMNMAKRRGMNLENTFLFGYDERADPRKNLDHLFANIEAEKKKGSFPDHILVVYVDKLANKSHGLLKLYERKHLVVTQHITTEVARKLIAQANTCSNIVNKLNCKLHGLNHSIKPDAFTQNAWITDNKSLIIGYDVAHPPPQLRSEILDKKPPLSPSVVGLSFNGGPHSEAFIGDFHYQAPRKEEVSDHVLISRMKWMLTLFTKNRGSMPENIFIYRDGVSEGQYAMAIERELEAIKQGVDEFCNMRNIQAYRPRYVLLIVTKRHNTRFVKEGYRGIENTLPGTVVDTGIVRADVTEFHLQGHRVLQGTGKTPSYVVLVDELDLSSDELQSFTFALCFSHQIFEGGISLPEPVYQADEWAKRGNDMWRAYEERYEMTKCQSNGEYSSAPIDFEAMTNMLAYWNTKLETSRINA